MSPDKYVGLFVGTFCLNYQGKGMFVLNDNLVEMGLKDVALVSRLKS